MNTYQITAVRKVDAGGGLQRAVERIDAERLDEAVERFFTMHPPTEWVITGEELIDVGTPEEGATEPEQPDTPEEGTAEPEDTPELNSYQITATFQLGQSGDRAETLALIKAESGKLARARFEAIYPPSAWTITSMERVKPGERREASAAYIRRLEKERAALEEGQAALRSALRQARQELAQAKELAEEQAIRADTAEEEIIHLKAKLYDYMTAQAQGVGA